MRVRPPLIHVPQLVVQAPGVRQAHVAFVISWWFAEAFRRMVVGTPHVVSMVDSHHGRWCGGRSIKQSRSDESSLGTAGATRMARRPQATTNRVQPQATSLRGVPGARPVRWFRATNLTYTRKHHPRLGISRKRRPGSSACSGPGRNRWHNQSGTVIIGICAASTQPGP